MLVVVVSVVPGVTEAKESGAVLPVTRVSLSSGRRCGRVECRREASEPRWQMCWTLGMKPLWPRVVE